MKRSIKPPKTITPKRTATKAKYSSIDGANHKYYFACIVMQGGAMSNVLIAGSIVDVVINYRRANMQVIIQSATEITAEEYRRLNEMAS